MQHKVFTKERLGTRKLIVPISGWENYKGFEK